MFFLTVKIILVDLFILSMLMSSCTFLLYFSYIFSVLLSCLFVCGSKFSIFPFVFFSFFSSLFFLNLKVFLHCPPFACCVVPQKLSFLSFLLLSFLFALLSCSSVDRYCHLLMPPYLSCVLIVLLLTYSLTDLPLSIYAILSFFYFY